MLHTLDSQDKALVANGKFTNLGLNCFWSAVDAAVQKWDRDQLNHKAFKAVRGNPSAFQKQFNRRTSGNDKYHWHKDKQCRQ